MGGGGGGGACLVANGAEEILGPENILSDLGWVKKPHFCVVLSVLESKTIHLLV